LTGGKPLINHSIPSVYGSWEPTLVYVPLKHFRAAKKFELLTTELFGPFSIVTEYYEKDTDLVLDYLE
jgi:1-pyrroline-5-carboxylate dehydrogenase